MEEAAKSFRQVRSVLDIGCGIRPQNYITPDVHICCDPHIEYLQILQDTLDYLRSYNKREDFKLNEFVRIRENVGINYVFLNADWEKSLEIIPEKSVDTVIISDVIEHLPKEKGRELISKTEKLARHQIIFFTPYGFVEQNHESERDEWGLNGGKWQNHLSGWLPEDFGEGWDFYICKDFHEFDNSGEKYVEPEGAFWAVKNLSDIPEYVEPEQKSEILQLIEAGETELQYESYYKSIDIFKGALDFDPYSAQAHNGLGYAYWNVGNLEYARMHFEKAVSINPVSKDYTINLAECLSQSSQAASAKAVYHEFLKIHGPEKEITALLQELENETQTHNRLEADRNEQI